LIERSGREFAERLAEYGIHSQFPFGFLFPFASLCRKTGHASSLSKNCRVDTIISWVCKYY
jgi:hypothetical protein